MTSTFGRLLALVDLPRGRLVLALGRIAHDSYLEFLRRGHPVIKARHPFAHGALHTFRGALEGTLPMLDSYHVSLQNTNTGTLTPAMFDAVLERAKGLAGVD